jgi:hypothetical protein
MLMVIAALCQGVVACIRRILVECVFACDDCNCCEVMQVCVCVCVLECVFLIKYYAERVHRMYSGCSGKYQPW